MKVLKNFGLIILCFTLISCIEDSIDNRKKNIFILILSAILLLSGCKAYKMKDGKMHYISYKGGIIPIEMEDVDISSFKVLSHGPPFAIDKYHIYFRNKVIDGADRYTFEIIKNKYHALSKDKNHVYNNEKVIIDADPQSFEIIDEYEKFFRDKSSLFIRYSYEILKVKDADPDSFIILDSRWFKDSKYLYTGPNKFLVDDIDTFTMFTEGVKNWQKDSKSIYWSGKKIPIFDRTTFQVENEYRAKDAKNYYFQHFSHPIDTETFRYFHRLHAIDKNGLYINFVGQEEFVILPGFDHTRFEMTSVADGCDGEFTYRFSLNRDTDPATITVSKSEMTEEARNKIIKRSEYWKFNLDKCISSVPN